MSLVRDNVHILVGVMIVNSLYIQVLCLVTLVRDNIHVLVRVMIVNSLYMQVLCHIISEGQCSHIGQL